MQGRFKLIQVKSLSFPPLLPPTPPKGQQSTDSRSLNYFLFSPLSKIFVLSLGKPKGSFPEVSCSSMVFIWKLKLLKGCVHSWALMALTSLFWGLHHSLPKRPLSAEAWVFSPCLSYIIGIPHLSDVHPHQSCCLWLSMDLIDSGFLSWAWTCLIITVLPNDH